jgi:hypothetical protein
MAEMRFFIRVLLLSLDPAVRAVGSRDVAFVETCFKAVSLE